MRLDYLGPFIPAALSWWIELLGCSEEGESFTAPVVINRSLLITHWGIKYSADNRPRLSWRAAAAQQCRAQSWPWNSCSGLQHLSPQRAELIQFIKPTSAVVVLGSGRPCLCTIRWQHRPASLQRPKKEICVLFSESTWQIHTVAAALDADVSIV